jgi:adenylate cyclase
MAATDRANRARLEGLTVEERKPGRAMVLVRRHGPRVLLVLGVFLLLLVNGAGLINQPFDFQNALRLHFELPEFLFSHGSLPQYVFSADFGLLALIGVGLSLALPLLTPIRASIAAALAIVPPFWLAVASPVRDHPLPLEYSLLTILVLYVVNVLASYFSETHARQQLEGVFGTYVPPELAKLIVQSPESFSMEGESREMTVFFSDIKNFSTISEQLDPRQLGRMLNRYFTDMTDVLQKHGATIDKYIGDSIMAFWSAPIPQADHARRSVLAAISMVEAVSRLRRTFREYGWPELDIGVGINTGLMNVGNMGSKYRVAYTVVGDAVNLAARLERLTRVYNARVLVTESTMATVQDVIFKEVDHVRVRGKGNATRVFEALCLTQNVSKQLLDNLAVHQRALSCYYRREWEQATTLFLRLHESDFNRPYCQLMLRRMAYYAKNPPPPDWNGVTNFSRRPMD